MPDFVDDKAVEGERDEELKEDDEFDGLPEDEAEASDSGSSDNSGSSSDEEDEEFDEKDKFIVQEGEEDEDEENEAGDEGAKKKKKKRRRRELVLEEEDYELLEENTGIRRVRPQQHRRLKKARDMSKAEGDQLDAEQLKEELFGPDDEDLEDDLGGDDVKDKNGGGGTLPVKASRPPKDADEDLDVFDEDEDDWIVDEFDGDDTGGREFGATGNATVRRRRRKAVEGLPWVDPAALDEANEIFGDVDDLLAEYESRRAQREGTTEGIASGDEDDAGAGLDEISDEEAAADLHDHRLEKRRETAARRAREHLEPGAIERHFLLPRDERIRETDIPEREQLHRGADPAGFNITSCAEWIYDRLLGSQRTNTKAQATLEEGEREVEGPPPGWMTAAQATWPESSLRGGLADTKSCRGWYQGRGDDEIERWLDNDEAQDALRGSIASALKLIYNEHEEIPLLGMFRKEQLGELLACRYSDSPAENTGRSRGCALPDGAISATDRRARRWEILYVVQQLAQQWRALQKRKEAREAVFTRAMEAHVGDEERTAVIYACIEAVHGVQTVEQLEDVDSKFRTATFSASAHPEESMAALDLHDGTPSVGSQGLMVRRRPQRGAASLHTALREGLKEAAAALGMTGRQFAENIEKGYKTHVPTDPSLSPEEFAASFVNENIGVCRDVDTVLKSVVHIAGAELAAEPAARQVVREFFWKNAVISTELTPAGADALNPFHVLGIAKRIRRKRVNKIYSDMFLRLVAAEKEGFVRIRIDLLSPSVVPSSGAAPDTGSGGEGPNPREMPTDQEIEEGNTAAVALLQDVYLSEGVGDDSQKWNDLRLAALREAVVSGMLPALRQEVVARLLSDARALVLQELSDKLWSIASRSPVSVKARVEDGDGVEEDEGGEEVAEKRIMAVCHGAGGGGSATTMVMLDASGALVDYAHCPQLTGHIPRPRVGMEGYSIFTDPRKFDDATKIKSFIEDHLPHVIVVGIAGPEAMTLYNDVKMIAEGIQVMNPRALAPLESSGISQIAVDERVAALWENSAAGKEEMPATAPIVRRCVALARQALDPLAVLASLCGPSKEVLSLALHPMQSHVADDAMLRAVDQVLCTVTAQVGIDLNAAASNAWLAPPLAFVPGLGPRKAAALLRAISRAGGFVESRQQIWRQLGVLGNCVFRNAAPFLRVRASSKSSANLELDPLDDTRIHPESYVHAVAVAQRVSEGVSDADVAVENAMALPHEVERLEIDLYDAHLNERKNDEADEGDVAGDVAPRGTSRLSTLIDIQMEFVAPYGEMRAPIKEYSEYSVEQQFWLACGEDESTVREGRRVSARIGYVANEFARCVIEELNGMEGIIRSNNVRSTASEVVDCRDHFNRGDTVPAVIKAVLPEQGAIELSTASTQLANDAHWEAVIFDHESAYHAPTKEEVMKAEAIRRRAHARASFQPRPIRHPLFKNVSMHDAAEEIRNAAVGSAIIRPDKRSLKTLHITMCLPGKLIWHIEVKETGPHTSTLQLAPPLQIQPVPGHVFSFDDLDELVARFIDPVGSALRAVQRHRKWCGEGSGHVAASWQQVQQALRQQRFAAPQMAAYCLAADDTRAGAFYLGYITEATPRREFFVVFPDGFYFRKEVYGTIDHLLAAFKRDPQNKKARAAAQQAQHRQEPPPAPAPYAQMQAQYNGSQQAGQDPNAYYGGQHHYDQHWGASTQDPYGQQYPPTYPAQAHGQYPPRQYPPAYPEQSQYGSQYAR